jgi:hypothetical protein
MNKQKYQMHLAYASVEALPWIDLPLKEVTNMATFPENEVGVLRNYIGVVGTKPSEKIETVVTAMPLNGPVGILEHSPFPPHNLINEAAVKRRRARMLLGTFLGILSTTLDSLDDVYTNLGKREFAAAESSLGKILPAGPDITASDIADAFATGNIVYVNISGKASEPIITRFIFPGYAGPVLDTQELVAAHQLVKGGAERDFQFGLLEAEINYGRCDVQSLVQAIQGYAKLLPAAVNTPTDMFGLHLDLFDKFISPDILTEITPRQKFAVIRSAFSHLALGDQFFRRQRALGDEERQNITRVYDTAVRLVQTSGIAPDNSRRQEVEVYATKQKAKVQSRLNFLGLWDAFVPVQRYTQLEQDAMSQITAAITSANNFFQFLDHADQINEHERDVQFQQDQENGNLQILDVRQNNATLSVDKIDEQLRAIDDQRASLKDELAVGIFKTVMEGAAKGVLPENAGFGLANTLLGIVGNAVNSSAQDDELAHQRRMAEIERGIASDGVGIAFLERDLSKHRIEFYAQKLAFLSNKRLNADYLYALAELNEKRAERQLEVAIVLAYLFERALAFFLGKPNIRHIKFDYLGRAGTSNPSLVKGGILDAANALQEDFQTVKNERDNFNEAKPDVFIDHISLRESYPLQFSRFLQTGKMDFAYSLYQLSKLRPASHQCRLREVGVEIKGLIPDTGFSGTLTHRGRFLVRDKDATISDPGATRLIPTDDQMARALEEQRRQGLAVAAVGGVLLYDLGSDTTSLSQNSQFVSTVPPNVGTLNIFEGHGPTGLWHLEIQNHERLVISDILLHFAIVGREPDIDVLEPKVLDLIRKFETELAEGDSLDLITGFSLRQNFPDTFFALQAGAATLSLGQENFPSGLTNLQFKLVIAQALDQQGKAVPGVTVEIDRQDFGFTQVRLTRADGFSEDLDASPQPLARGHRFPIIGTWGTRLPNAAQFAQLGDLRLFFMYAFEKL